MNVEKIKELKTVVVGGVMTQGIFIKMLSNGMALVKPAGGKPVAGKLANG